jgi:hypothetical protein
MGSVGEKYDKFYNDVGGEWYYDLSKETPLGVLMPWAWPLQYEEGGWLRETTIDLVEGIGDLAPSFPTMEPPKPPPKPAPGVSGQDSSIAESRANARRAASLRQGRRSTLLTSQGGTTGGSGGGASFGNKAATGQ